MGDVLAKGLRGAGPEALVGELVVTSDGSRKEPLVAPLLVLNEGEKGGGPVTLPRPSSMSVDTVKIAHTAFNHVVGWRDAPSLEWLCFGLRMAHRHKKYKTAALRMLARVATTGTHVGGRTTGAVLKRLKLVAREVALTLTPELLRYETETSL